ncbi:MAG TPA: 5'-nucleotidase C-terminal domain-containing protein, partial [Actinomycetes bacterium]
GAAEVLRMADGGCLDDGDGLNNQNSCPIAGHEFAGADFDYLAANVVDDATGDTLLPGVSIKELDGVKIGFIGMTLEGTPSIVTPAGVAGLSFKDEVATANKLVPSLVRQGVRSIVVLLHEGGFPSGGYNECPGISGPIVDIAANLSPQIDAVITGHTHQAYNCTLPDPDGQPRLVTSASSLGRIITDINLKINTRSHDVVRSSSSAVNRIVTRDVAKDPEITSLMNQYGAIIAPIANAVVGSTAEPITRPNAPQTPMGQVIADAQLAATRAAEDGGAQLALMNPGGVRAELDAGDVTYGEAFAVQPFANALTTVTLTGAQLKAVLEQQRSNLILQPSTGFRFTFTASAPAGARVSDITLGGAPIDPAASYRVTANNFLTTGGDGFTAFLAGTDIKNGVIDLDALTKYIHDNSPLHVPADFPRVTIG